MHDVEVVAVAVEALGDRINDHRDTLQRELARVDADLARRIDRLDTTVMALPARRRPPLFCASTNRGPQTVWDVGPSLMPQPPP